MRNNGSLLILISVTVNAFMPVLFKYLYDFIDPLSTLVIIGFFGFFVSFILFRPSRKTLEKVRKHSRLFLITGVFGWSLNGVLYLMGLKLTTMSSAVLMVQSTYIFSIIFAFKFLGEKVNRWEIVGMIFAAIGIFLVAWNGMDINEILRSENFIGNMLIFTSGLAWSTYATGQKKILKTFNPKEILPVFTLFGAITSLSAVFVMGYEIKPGFFTLMPIASILFIVIIGTVVSTIIAMEGLKRIKLLTANVIGNMYPVMGVMFSVLLLSETLSSFQVMGGIAIILGSVISSLKAGSN